MRQIITCPFCNKSNPDNSIFCAYCGKKIAGENNDSDRIIPSNLEVRFRNSLQRIKKQVANFISGLETKIEDSETLSFVNKQRILNILNQIQFQDQKEMGVTEEELTSWAENVEAAISGDKCIICLQEFDVKDNEQFKVILCPSCNYAGHPNHFLTWLDTKNTCPMCRGNLTKKNLVRGYLEWRDEQLIFKKAEI